MAYQPRRLPDPFNLLALLFALLSFAMVAGGSILVFVPDLVPVELRPPTQAGVITPTLITAATPPAHGGGNHSAILPPASPTAAARIDGGKKEAQTPTEVFIPSPSVTFTATPSLPTATAGISPSPTVSPPLTLTVSPYPFIMQAGSPIYTRNRINTAACDWLGIIGQVYDAHGKPLIGLFVHVSGNGLDYASVTGSKPRHGVGGYELYLSDRPARTVNTYRLQVRDSSGAPLSAVYPITTSADCNQNLIVLNFEQR